MLLSDRRLADDDVIHSAQLAMLPAPPEETVQAIFASALSELEEARRTIGLLQAERDSARTRIAELEHARPADEPGPPGRVGGWTPALAAAGLLVLAPLVLALGLTHAGIPVLTLSGQATIGFKDIVEVLVVGLVATVLVQSWVSHAHAEPQRRKSESPESRPR